MIKNIHILFFFTLLTFCAGCSNFNQAIKEQIIPPNAKTGSLQIKVNYNNQNEIINKKTLVKTGIISLYNDEYKITKTHEFMVEGPTVNVTINDLVIGTWQVKAELYDEDKILLYSGENSIDVKEKDNEINLELTKVGLRDLNIYLSFPGIFVKSGKIILKQKNTVNKEDAYNLNFENYQCNQQIKNIKCGEWEYTINLYNETGNLVYQKSNEFNLTTTITIKDTDNEPVWQFKADMPTARYGLAVGVVNNKIYVIGGYNYSSDYLNTVEEYDPATDTWQQKASMPTARYSLAVCVVNNKIYAIGGYKYNYYSSGFLNTVEEYDPATDTWQQKTNMPTARFGLAVGVVNNKIYAIGGYNDNGFLNTVEEYDPATDTWQQKTNMPTARDRLAIGVANNKIYAIGGCYWRNLNTVEEYDPATDTWQQKTNMPTARYGLAVGVVNNKIYAIGGEGKELSNIVEEYDPATDIWNRKADIRIKKAYFAVGVVNNKIYAIGGYTNSSFSTVEEYDLSN